MLSIENRVNMVSMESIPDIFGFVKFFAGKLAYCIKDDTLI
jgi:hypothetical protein